MRIPAIHPSAFRIARRVKSWPAAILGGFILWQLIYLPLANLLEFYPHRVHRVDELTDYRELPPELVTARPAVHALAAATDCWGQLTGQYQMWWLFAPSVPPQATFPAVELRWNNLDLAPLTLRSSLEPIDTTSYFRPPGSGDRLLHYEMHLGLWLTCFDPQSAADSPAEWQTHFRDLVRGQWKSLRAYCRWRLAGFQLAHPELPPPDEIRLHFHLYRTPPPGEMLNQPRQPVIQPVARWRLTEQVPPDMLPLEAYDPIGHCFLPLELEAGRGEGARYD